VVANRTPAPTIAAPATPVVTKAGVTTRGDFLRCLDKIGIPFEEEDQPANAPSGSLPWKSKETTLTPDWTPIGALSNFVQTPVELEL
jgi:hypothetical protein